MINNIKNKIKDIIARRNSNSYIKHLRINGIHIGGGGVILHPKTTFIDLTRPSLITIGNNVFINRNFTLLTHDWVANVFLKSGRQFINSSGRVTIGNNVSFAQNVTILKGVTIGDNCFIGYGSLVTKNIPANSIAVGTPCKVIMTLDEFYQKRLLQCKEEALDYARSIKERYNRMPIPSDFWEEFPFFVNGDEVDKYPDIPIKNQLGPTYNNYKAQHVAPFRSFEKFLEAAGI